MIEAAGLSKRYGATMAVENLSFIVPPGLVTGFLGPNGAGKSTTMRLILGLDAPTSGSVTVSGRSYTAYRRPLTVAGAMLEAKAFHGGLVGLASAARKRAGGFSLGMGQRLGIAAALLGDPPVLMLDEPVNGLDPEGVVWIRTLLKSLAAQGRTVLLSSHLMSEMALTADRLIIIGRGRLITQTTMAEFLAGGAAGPVRARSPQAAALAAVLRASGATIAGEDGDTLTITGTTSDTVGELARANGLTLTELSAQQASLEDRYMQLTRDSADYRSTAGPLAAAGK
jgi:ABC-2 type transport system ATP-binding protein